jgi:hypothetical protein
MRVIGERAPSIPGEPACGRWKPAANPCSPASPRVSTTRQDYAAVGTESSQTRGLAFDDSQMLIRE